MTTIAYRDGVLAADSRSEDSCTKVFCFPKIYKVAGRLVGMAGCVSKGQEFLEWLRAGGERLKIDEDRMSAIALLEDGSVEVYEDTTFWLDLPPGEFYAVGSGAAAALAAMHCGKSAAEAVEIACRVDPSSEGPVVTRSW